MNSDRPKRWTWKEWNAEGLGKIRWTSEAFHANDEYIDALEARDEESEEMIIDLADTIRKLEAENKELKKGILESSGNLIVSSKAYMGVIAAEREYVETIDNLKEQLKQKSDNAQKYHEQTAFIWEENKKLKAENDELIKLQPAIKNMVNSHADNLKDQQTIQNLTQTLKEEREANEKVWNTMKERGKIITKLKEALEKIIKHSDVDNEGVTAHEYVLVEIARKALEELEKGELLQTKA